MWCGGRKGMGSRWRSTCKGGERLFKRRGAEARRREEFFLGDGVRAIFDSHLDLAWNALSFNRDLTVSVEEIRAREEGMNDEPGRGRNTLTLVELRKAMVPVCVATLIARSGPQQKRKEVSKRSDLDFSAQSIAYAAAHAQLAYYKLLEEQGHVRMIRTKAELKSHWNSWLAEHRTSNIEHRTSKEVPLGIIL